jgi:hypothetical protein
LDLYGLRDKLAARGVEYLTATEYESRSQRMDVAT